MRLVGTVTMFFAAVNLMRIVPYFALGHLTRENLTISLALLPLAIAANFLGFWLVLRTSTELFYRIAYALMFLISAAIFAQGVTGLLRGSAILACMRALLFALLLASATAAAGLRPAGPSRRARPCAREHAGRFCARALDRRHDARARPRDDPGRRAGGQPRPPPQPDHTRGPDGKFLDAEGPAIRALTLRRAAALRRRPAQAGQRLCGELSGAAAGRRRAHSDARGAVRAGRPQRRRSRALQHRNQDHADLRRRDARSRSIRRRGRDGDPRRGPHGARERAVVRLAHAHGDAPHRPGDRARLPHRRGAEFRHDQARRAGAVALDRRARHRRVRRLGAAAGRGRGLRGLVAALPQRQGRTMSRPPRRSASR